MPKRRDSIPSQGQRDDLTVGANLTCHTCPRHRRERVHVDVTVKAAQGTGIMDIVLISGSTTTILKRIAGLAANTSVNYESGWIGERDQIAVVTAAAGTGTYDGTIMTIEFDEQTFK